MPAARGNRGRSPAAIQIIPVIGDTNRRGPMMTGEILADARLGCGGLGYRVRLDDGQEIVAAIPKSVAREIFRIVPGDKVRVAGLEVGKPRIVGFAR